MCFCNFVLSKNRNNLLVKVVAMYNWSNFNMTRHFEPKTTREGKREPCRDCGKLFKTSILQSHQRIHTKRSNFQRKVQPSTLVPAQTSFGSWINIGWNPAWGGCAILFLKFWHSETSYCTAIGRWLWAVVCWLYYVDQGGQYWNFDKKNTPERPRHTLGCGL